MNADRTVVLRVPYHIDEHLPDLDLPLPAPPAGQVITAGPAGAGVWGTLAALYTAVAAAVAGAARDGGLPVVVSGDCTTALGTVAGLQRAGTDPAVVWIDAHGDLQTLETTASGYLGGLPLRLLAGYRPELIANRLGLRPVPAERILLAGARDLDPPEADYLARVPVRRASLEQCLADRPDGPLYVHLDLDITDPGYLPGLRYPAPGGADPAAVAATLGGLLRTGQAAAVGIACTWRPGQGAAARIGPYLEAALSGATALPRTSSRSRRRPAAVRRLPLERQVPVTACRLVPPGRSPGRRAAARPAPDGACRSGQAASCSPACPARPRCRAGRRRARAGSRRSRPR